MKYKPEYAKEQILVRFKMGECSEEFARDFGKALGYEFLGKYDYAEDVFIYRANAGKETNAVKIFQGNSRIVDWASLRDIKLERRLSILEKASGMIKDLHDCVELPDRQYTGRLRDISSFLSQKS